MTRPIGPIPKGPTRKQAKSQKDRENDARMLEWHATVIEKGRVPYLFSDQGQAMYRCFHCKWQFPKDEIIGDHWPHTRGARKDLMYDVRNGQPTCKSCNRSDNPNRKKPTEADLAPFYRG